MKQTFEAGDRVVTPLGSGEVISCRAMNKPEGQIRCKVRHDDYRDHEGDTFDVDAEHLHHESVERGDSDVRI